MPGAPEGNWKEREERDVSMAEARMDEERERQFIGEETENDLMFGDWEWDDFMSDDWSEK